MYEIETSITIKDFLFKEDISSSISPSSNLHETFCLNSTPSEILLARENMNSTKMNRPILSNVHSYLTFITNVYDLEQKKPNTKM